MEAQQDLRRGHRANGAVVSRKPGMVGSAAVQRLWRSAARASRNAALRSKMAEKPILVAGKSGQLARCLRDLAFLRNMPMVAVGRPELDLENGEGIDRMMATVEPSAIVNAAAYTAVDPAQTGPETGLWGNCGGAQWLSAP